MVRWGNSKRRSRRIFFSTRLKNPTPEPDRTVTEAAVIALTVRTDPSILSRIDAAEKNLQDVVIHDDLDNARMVIAERAKYLATDRGKTAGGSIDSAVRTYFLPALEPPPQTPAEPRPTPNFNGKKPIAPAIRAPKLVTPIVRVEVRSVTLSPDKNRALARGALRGRNRHRVLRFRFAKALWRLDPRQCLAWA